MNVREDYGDRGGGECKTREVADTFLHVRARTRHARIGNQPIRLTAFVTIKLYSPSSRRVGGESFFARVAFLSRASRSVAYRRRASISRTNVHSATHLDFTLCKQGRDNINNTRSV